MFSQQKLFIVGEHKYKIQLRNIELNNLQLISIQSLQITFINQELFKIV
jgi:hypothetical protein